MGYDFPLRKIIHIAMDAFYASVEQLDNPELKGKPIAVGGSEKRVVVSAASYEARTFGVKSAMSGIQAKRNCPELIFVKPRFDRYHEMAPLTFENAPKGPILLFQTRTTSRYWCTGGQSQDDFHSKNLFLVTTSTMKLSF